MQLIDHYADKSVKKFAKSIKIPQQTVNRLFNIDTRTGKYPFATTELLVSIIDTYVEIDAGWLMTGRGKMMQNSPIQSPEPPVIYNSDPKDADIIRIQTQTIDDKNKIISMQEEKIRGLEAQLSTRPTGLVTAHSVGITQEVEKRHK